MTESSSNIIGMARHVRFRAERIDMTAHPADLIIIGLFEPNRGAAHTAPPPAPQDCPLGGMLERLQEGGIFPGRFGETLTIDASRMPVGAHSLLLVGMGQQADLSPQRSANLMTLATQCVLRMQIRSVHCLINGTAISDADNGCEIYASHIMRGILQTLRADTPQTDTAPMDWTFDTGPEESGFAIKAFRQVLDAWTD